MILSLPDSTVNLNLRPYTLGVRHEAAHEIIEGMRTNRLAFALFAAAILFSMVREWSAPVACERSILLPPSSASLSSR